MNNNITLFLLSLIGVSALYLGSKKEKALKEDFDGFSLTNVQVEDLAVPTGNKGQYTTMQVPQNMYPALKGISQPSVNVSVGQPSGFAKAIVYPGDPTNNTQQDYMSPPRQANVTLPASFLGSAAVTNSPYISQPNYMQSANRNIQQGNVQFSSWQQVAPPPADIMGMSPPCDNNNQQPLRENFADSPWGKEFPGVAYAAGNYNNLAGYAPCDDKTTVADVQVMKASNPFSASGNAQTDIYNYTRNMTTTRGTSTRTNRFSGARDLFRGDIPIAPTSGSDATSLFGYASANATSLNFGSLQQMGGDSQSTQTMKNFMKAYGKTTKESAPLPKMSGQTLPQLMASTASSQIGGGDTLVTSFA